MGLGLQKEAECELRRQPPLGTEVMVKLSVLLDPQGTGSGWEGGNWGQSLAEHFHPVGERNKSS